MAVLRRLWSLRQSRPVFVIASGLLFAYFLFYPVVDIWLRSIDLAPQFRMWDFGAYGGAFNRWQDGAVIYERNAQGGFSRKFLYPPIALLLFYPFLAVLPAVQSVLAESVGNVVLLGDVIAPLLHTPPKVYWAIFSLLFAWLGLQYAVSAFGLSLSRLERGLLLWAMLGFHPLLLSVKMGQMAAFQVGLLSFSLGALVGPGHRTARRSGAATALVGLVKPSYSYVGAHLLANRERMVGALATGAVVMALSVLVFGIDTHVAYLDVLAWGIEKGNSARSPALWLVPYYKPLAWIPNALTVRLLAAGFIILGALLAAPRADRAVFALGVTAFPLFTPTTYTYYLAALLPAVVALLAIELADDGYPLLVLLGLFLVAIHSFGLFFIVDILPKMLNLGQTLRPFYPVLQPGLWGNALLVSIATLRVGQAVERPTWTWLPVEFRPRE